MEFNLRQLRMLKEVSERGTMAAAADALGYTASAVSQQLAALERGTGVDLLERVGRNVRLTDGGRELVRHAEVLLADAEAAQVALESVASEPRGTVLLSVYESVATTLVPPMLDLLDATWPDIDLRIRQVGALDMHPMLLRGDLDIVFDLDYEHPPLAAGPGLTATPIIRDWYQLVVPADDDLDGVVDLAELEQRLFVQCPQRLPCGRCTVAACRRAGFEPRARHEVDEYSSVLRLVASGAGVALVPGLGLTSLPDAVRVLDLTEPFSRVVQLTYRTASASRPAITKVIEAATEVATDLGLDTIT